MSLDRLQNDEVYRFYLAHRLAFADWTAPTTAELNANSTNAPDGLIWNITCALNTDGCTFDLDDSERDESLTFCQTSGDSSALSYSATVVLEFEESKVKWDDATSVLAADGFNTANLTKSLLMWRDIPDLFVIMSVGKAHDAAFAVGDRIKMSEIATDWAVPVLETGANVRHSQAAAKRSDILWNYELAT
jgi:hypothetical protein